MSWRAKDDDDLDRELRDHLDLEAEDRRTAGLSGEEARNAAHRALGNTTLIKEDVRSIRGWPVIERLAQDVRYALRAMRKNPGFTAVSVLSLALGIGANTAVFTFVNAALLQPLPYPDAGRIAAIQQRPLKGGANTRVHPRSFVPWSERTRSFEAMTIVQAIPVNTEGADGAEQVPGLWSTPELFQVFGVTPILGHTFSGGEGYDRAAIRAEAPASGVAILSHGYWQRRFASDPKVLGRTMPIGRGSATVIGVMPPGFRAGSLNVDIYLPLPLNRNSPQTAGSRGFQCFARLRPGVTIEAAQAEMTALAVQVGRDDPVERDFGVVVRTLRDYLAGEYKLVLLVLSGVTGFVLLIACANLAGLLLTRGIGRQSELALRASLGASRQRLVQQLVVESAVLSLSGGAAGLVLGWWASRALALLARDAVDFGQLTQPGLDPMVLAFTGALSLATALLFGLAPALQATGANTQAALKERARGGGSGRGQQRMRAALVSAEVAIAAVLLIGAGLLVRTLSHLLDVKLGFQPEQALTMRTFITGDPAVRSGLIDRILDRVESLPGVGAAGVIQFLPLSGWTNNGPFHFLGRPKPADPMTMESDVSTVSRGYLAAIGIPLLRGRDFGKQDRFGSPRVALVNQAFVAKFSPGEDPIGHMILGDWADPKPTQIVGIVGDVRHNGLTAEPRPTVFLSQAQVPGYITYLVIRTPLAPDRIAAAIRKEVRAIDRRQPFTDVQPMQHYVATALAKPSLYANLTGAFAGLALVLAAVGLYGLMAYSVSRRTHEIGVRMALGARPRDVLRSILGDGAKLVITGLAIGLAAAAALSRVLGSLLYGVTANDPVAYIAGAALLAGVAALAAYLPSRRASKVDPVVALRYE
jgi:putative ABC transport system permease protein